MENQRFIEKAQAHTLIDKLKAEYVGVLLNNELTKMKTKESSSNIEVNKQQLTNMAMKIAQDWRALEISGQGQSADARSKEHQNWVNDLQQSTGLPQEVISRVIQAIILRQAVQQPTRNPIGFK